MKSSNGPAPSGELALRVVALERDTNANGDIYAGWLMSQMDLAAANMAGRIAKGRTATVCVDKMEFLSPVRVGAEVSCYAQLTDIGRSSMKIQVEVWTRDPCQTQERKVTETQFVFVAIDGDGRIRPVPEQ